MINDKIRVFSVILLSAIACFGCVPVTWTDAPAIHGVVIDATTKSPIAGAQIDVVSMDPTNSDAHSKAISDTSGHFVTAEISHRIWMPLLPFDRFAPGPDIDVLASGYVEQKFHLYELPRKSQIGFDVELGLTHQ